ncbi:MAG: DUF547 domain-containing protein [Bdellovibrionales bacterium]|nr:DUF547 domain-containing protein [Bdellovibrionales bacterium]
MIQVLKSVFLVGAFTLIGWNQAFAFDHSHSNWNEIVQRSVTWTNSTSTVNYKDLKSNSKALDHYLKELSEVKSSDFDRWSRNEQLAFLINAYNAWTIKLILENYPVKSIKDIGGIFSSPWKKKFFKLFDKEASLDWIEHEKIRPIYSEPRIHFALVCASIGCPGIRAEAFIAEKLNQQLDDSTKRFLNDSSRNHYDPAKKELALSSIFKWYKDDFVKAKGTVQAFIFPYMDSLKSEPSSSVQNLSIRFLEYNWSLNEK